MYVGKKAFSIIVIPHGDAAWGRGAKRVQYARITGVHIHQDQIWLVKPGAYIYIGFMLIAGPDYCGPP